LWTARNTHRKRNGKKMLRITRSTQTTNDLAGKRTKRSSVGSCTHGKHMTERFVKLPLNIAILVSTTPKTSSSGLTFNSKTRFLETCVLPLLLLERGLYFSTFDLISHRFLVFACFFSLILFGSRWKTDFRTRTNKKLDDKKPKIHFRTDIFFPISRLLIKVRNAGGTIIQLSGIDRHPRPMALIFSNSFPPLEISMWLDRILPSYLFFQLLIFFFFHILDFIFFRIENT